MNTGFFFNELAAEVLTSGKPFDGMAPGVFWDMYGRKVTINKKDFPEYLNNTKQAIEFSKTDAGEVIGLPIDCDNHDKGDGAGWIVDASIQEVEKPDGTKIPVMRFAVHWTEIGKELIEKGIRRMFSPTVDTENKIVLGGSLTNWPATRDKVGKVLLRPIELSAGETTYEMADDVSLDEQAWQVRDAFRQQYPPDKNGDFEVTGPFVRDVFEDFVIISQDGNLYRAAYSRNTAGEIEFAAQNEWVKVRLSWVEAAKAAWRKVQEMFFGYDMAENDLASFDESEWDAGAVEKALDVADFRKVCLMDLNGYPGQEGDPIKGLCKLPVKKTPGSAYNKAALRACGGAHGIGAVTKPGNVPQDFYEAEREKAAKKLISLWRPAFDTDAPATIYKIAGQEVPAEASQDNPPGNGGEGENEMTKEELLSLITGMSDEEKKSLVGLLKPAEPQAEPGEQKPDILALFDMEGSKDAVVAELKKSWIEQTRALEDRAKREAAETIANAKREAAISEFCDLAIGGRQDAPRGLPVDAGKLKTFCASLQPDQLKFFQDLTNAVQTRGLVEFQELGNGKQPKGTLPLPEYYAAKLESGELKLADLRNPLLAPELGNISQYDLRQWDK